MVLSVKRFQRNTLQILHYWKSIEMTRKIMISLGFSLFSRVPYSFLLLGGIIGTMSLIGILLTNEPKEKPKKEEKETEDSTSLKLLTSLTPIQVLKTRIFYLVIWGN